MKEIGNYLNNYSEAVSGWKMINGVKYYFDAEDHYMYTGYHVIKNGELWYYFNADGSCRVSVDRRVVGIRQKESGTL